MFGKQDSNSKNENLYFNSISIDKVGGGDGDNP